MENRLIAFNEAREASQSGAKPESEKRPEAKPIDAARVRDDVQRALDRLSYLDGYLQEDAVRDFRKKLETIREKYKKIDENNIEALQALEKEIYQECGPFLERATKQQLSKCKNISDHRFEKSGMSFTLGGENMTAELTNLYEVRSVQMLEASVTFRQPIRLDSFDERVGQNALNSLRLIAKRFDVKGLTVTGTEARFEFTAKEDKEKKQFVASSQDLLEVKQVPSAQKIKDWMDARKTTADLAKRRGAAMRGMRDLSKGGDMMMEMEMMHMGKGMREMDGKSRIDVSKFTPEQKKLWDACLALDKQYQEASTRDHALRRECGTRTLEGRDSEGKPVTVREEGDPQWSSNFEWAYLDGEGKDKTRLNWVSGRLSEKTEYEKGERVRETRYHFGSDMPNVTRDFKAGTLDQYDEKGGKMYRKTFDPKKPDTILETRMYDKGGKLFGTLDLERKEQPKLTEDQYLDMLAKKLDTPQKLGLFLELFMQYTHDSDDPKDPLKKGTDEQNEDYWQKPQETVRRLEDWKMLGDCDDYSFLAREVLRKQGKNVHACMVNEHATCVWVEKRKDGRYDGYSVCTFGLHKNGFTGADMEREPAQKGFETVEDALNSVLKKFQPAQLDGFVISAGKPREYDVRKDGVLGLERGPSEEHIYTPLPFEAFENREIGEKMLLIIQNLDGGKGELAAAEAAALLKKFPESPAAQLLGAIFLYPNDRAAAEKMFQEATKNEGTSAFSRELIERFGKSTKGKDHARLYDGVYVPLMEMAIGRTNKGWKGWKGEGHDLVEAYERHPEQQKQNVEATKAILRRGVLGYPLIQFISKAYEQGEQTDERKEERSIFFQDIEKNFLGERKGKVLTKDELTFAWCLYRDGMQDRSKMIDIYQKQSELLQRQYVGLLDSKPEKNAAQQQYLESIRSLFREQSFAGRIADGMPLFAKLERSLSPEELRGLLPSLERGEYQPKLADMYERTLKGTESPAARDHAELGHYYLQGKQYENALIHCSQSIEPGTDQTIALSDLKEIRTHVSKKKWEVAAAILLRTADKAAAASQAGTSSDKDLYFIAEAYCLLDQSEKAVVLYCGRVERQKKLYDAAGTEERDGIAREYYYAHLELAELYVRIGRKEDAVATYRTMLGIFKNKKERIVMDITDLEGKK